MRIDMDSEMAVSIDWGVLFWGPYMRDPIVLDP